MCILNCWFADYRCIRTFNCVTRSRYFVFNRFGHRVFCSTMVESRISMRASSWSTPVSLLDFVKKKKSMEKSNFHRKSYLKIVLDSNYYILIVQLSQRDPIILKFRTQSKKPHRAVIEISHPPCLSIEAKAGMNNRGWAHFWGQDHVCTRRRPRSFLIDRKSSISQEVGVISRLFSLSLSLHVQRDPDVSIFASLPLGKPPRLVEIRDRFARGTKDGRAHLCRFPFTFYRWKEFIVYR